MSKETKNYTVKWQMKEDNIIRFVESDDPMEMSDSVAKLDFDKLGIVEGAQVKVEIENNTVMSIVKIGGALPPKQEEKSQEAKTSTVTTSKTLTVGAYNLQYKGIAFKEEDKVWYDVVEEIGIENFEKMGIKKGSRVTIITEDPKGKSKNRRVVGIKLVDEAKEEPKTENPAPKNDFPNAKTAETTTATGNSRDDFYRIKELERTVRFMKEEQRVSIEAQGAVERAFTLVGSMVSKESAESNVKNKELIKGMLKDYAKEAFNLIQELKQPKV